MVPSLHELSRFLGFGEQEVARYEAGEGLMSAQINAKNCLGHKVDSGVACIVSCRGHYENT